MSESLAVEKENLRVRAYAVLRKALMTGKFQPGQKLLLKPLADELGISVTPVREALLQLVSERALVTDSSRSLFVPKLKVDCFREIRDLRIELEGRAAEAGARYAVPADIKELEEIQRRLVMHRHAGRFGEVSIANDLVWAGRYLEDALIREQAVSEPASPLPDAAKRKRSSGLPAETGRSNTTKSRRPNRTVGH